MGTGVMFGVATLLRANGLIGFVAIPASLLLGARSWRPALRMSVISAAAMAIVLAPSSLNNQIRFGNPNVASESGISLYAGMISWDRIPPSPDSADGNALRCTTPPTLLDHTARWRRRHPSTMHLSKLVKTPAEAARCDGRHCP